MGSKELESLISQLFLSPTKELYEKFSAQIKAKIPQNFSFLIHILPRLIKIFSRDFNSKNIELYVAFFIRIYHLTPSVREVLKCLGYLTHNALVGSSFTGIHIQVQYL
jgi:hypothetical protein